ncbi:MAG: DUF2079 domain-containing protein [Candidatus Levybacteria bacterium]|nr:DUF2079 domain-containing protein [Candidatus Levybacteria bacterium]
MKAVKNYLTDGLKKFSVPLGICLIFFIFYSILGVVRHNYYGSFGADLGFIDRQFWIYSHFSLDGLLTGSHFEFTSLFLSSLYWLWSDPRMLIIFQAFVITFSGVAVFLLAKRRKLKSILCYIILLSYLTFFGIQNALWFDVHSSVWGTAFFMWFIYFLDTNNRRASIITFFLTIGSKENMAAYVFLFTVVYFLMTRKKDALLFVFASIAYLLLLFKIVFPAILPKGYTYSSSQGLVSGSPFQLFDSAIKRETLFYTFAWFGFVPLLLPLYAIPILGNLASYFILGREYVAAHEIFMHYRVDLAPLLVSSTIFVIGRFRRLNSIFTAVYLLICLLFFQYTLHSPLSYLTKSWFWTKPSGVDSINKLIKEIPHDSDLAAQNNIFPHVSQRRKITLIWPDERTFKKNSPCGKQNCPWLRWDGSPKYIVVDLSPEWDIRHLLWQNNEYKMAINGLEKEKIISLHQQVGTAKLYIVNKKPK